MAYRRPGIKVTQEFADLAPALAPFNLPNCIVGPAYQVVSQDELGSYDGTAITVSYAGLNAGNIVDIAPLDENELKDHQYPVAVTLADAKIEQLSVSDTGSSLNELVEFYDATTNAFGDVVAGDELEVFEKIVEIVAAQTNGSVSDTNSSLLIGASATEFANVNVGDLVEISGGTNVIAGTYTVSSLVDAQQIILDSSFYTGVGTVANVAYRIDRQTGTLNQGVYLVADILDANTLKLATPLTDKEAPLSYRILRQVDSIDLTRVTHFSADDAGIEVFAALTLNGKPITEGTILSDYRGLRVDLAANVKEYKSLADLQAEFGVDQIVPANPLAFGLAIGLQNTVTEVNGLGLNALFLTNDTLAFQASLDVLKKTDMYALCPLSQRAVVHQLYSSHVTQMSLPTAGKERVAVVNKKIITEETIQDSSTTSGERTIVNTQTDGLVVLGSNLLSTITAGLFTDVQPGDVVVIVGGTGVTPGQYVVASVNTGLEIALGDGFSATYNGSDVQYFIKRLDGIEANGQIFYDSNAQFITDGVSVGYNLVVEVGTFAGSYTIVAVNSNKELVLDQVPGIVSVQSLITYNVVKDLTNSEIADFISGYASSFANRRLVVTFPDTVKIPEGSVLRELPGFYLGCAVVALTTGLPTQQGFTNLTVSGYLGFINGSDRFDEDQLDSIADGGVMIFDQEVPEAPLYIRHQLTTDRSAIKFQEYSVTKNVDFIAKFMRNAFKSYIGTYNIVDETLDELKGTAQSVLTFLRDETVLPAIGGVIRSGRLTALKEGANIDTIDMRFALDIPIPLNNIDITIQV